MCFSDIFCEASISIIGLELDVLTLESQFCPTLTSEMSNVPLVKSALHNVNECIGICIHCST